MQTTQTQSSTLYFKPVEVAVAVTVTPGTPDSANILIGAAGLAAHEKRRNHYKQQQQQQQQQQQLQQHKTIMNCFRDRSSSYTRCNQHNHNHYTDQTVVKYNKPTTTPTSPAAAAAAAAAAASVSSCGSGRPEAVVFLRELRTRPNKLALLKSNSTRDLSRLLLDQPPSLSSSSPNKSFTTLDVDINCTNSNFGKMLKTIDANPSTSSSSSASSASATASVSASASSSSISIANSSLGQQSSKNEQQRSTTEYCKICKRHLNEMKQRLENLEHDLHAQNAYTKELETKLNELTKLIATATNNNDDKRKKSFYNRKKSGTATTVHPSKFVAWMNLSNWWKSRPSIETLKQRNIYNDEPCFDTEIELVLKHEVHKAVPRIVVDCCDLIEELYRRSAQPIEGIYRQCGDYNKIQTLRFNIDANDYESLRQPNIDIHTLSGVLKLFLREIKSPLVSTNEAKTFIGKPNQWLLTELPTKIDILKRLIRSLPEINRDTMDYIFAHFNRLTKVPLQQISADTLSISVTPSIFHIVPQGVHMQDMHELLRESETLADCVKIMIEYHQRIFECSTDRRLRQRLSVSQLKKTLSQPELIFHNLF